MSNLDRGFKLFSLVKYYKIFSKIIISVRYNDPFDCDTKCKFTNIYTVYLSVH